MRDRKTILYLLILSTFLLSMMALLASAETSHTNSAKSSALYNPDTKTFLQRKNAEAKLPMASTTKIVTALVAIESLDLDEIITVQKEAVGIEGSSLYLKEGDKLTVRDLVYSVLLQSANDASCVLALRISGGIPEFADKMNARAKAIGAKNTNFENPHGLDSANHYTTAEDLCLIAAEALSNDIFKKISSTYKYSFNIGDSTRTVINHNKLLKTYDGCIGVKTGFTKKCGRCLVSAATKQDITLIAVTLNDPDDWRDHRSMLNYGFDNLEAVDISDLTELPEDLPTVSADGARVAIKPREDTLVKYKNEDIKFSLDLPPYISKDLKSGDKIGEIIINVGDREKTIDIIATNGVKIKKNTKRFF